MEPPSVLNILSLSLSARHLDKSLIFVWIVKKALCELVGFRWCWRYCGDEFGHGERLEARNQEESDRVRAVQDGSSPHFMVYHLLFFFLLLKHPSWYLEICTFCCSRFAGNTSVKFCVWRLSFIFTLGCRRHVWANFCLAHHNEKLLDEGAALQDFGVRNNSQVLAFPPFIFLARVLFSGFSLPVSWLWSHFGALNSLKLHISILVLLQRNYILVNNRNST